MAENEILIKKYVPILHFHEEEAFLPEDCKIMVERGNLCAWKDNKEIDESFSHTLDGLPTGKESKKYFLNLPMFDMNNFTIEEKFKSTIKELGPRAISQIARERLGNNPILGYNARQGTFKYYVRIKNTQVSKVKDDPFTIYFEQSDPTLFGDYTVIQYLFYFVFNDSWNKHESDWDSTVEIYVNKENNRTFVVSYLHETCMAGELKGPMFINRWLEEWNKSEKGFKPVFCFSGSFKNEDQIIDSLHPNIFVTLGGHGGYLTPGFTLHGLDPKLFKQKLMDKIIISSDERQIGKLVVYPNESVGEQMITSSLASGGIDVNKTKLYPWKDFEILTNQTWLRYGGKWGEDTEFTGWDGPKGPGNKWKASELEFKDILTNAYEGKLPKNGIQNWNGWNN